MKQIVLAFLIFTIASISSATAVLRAGGATGVGDGGTGVVCTSENGYKTYELLDLYEAKHFFGFDVSTAWTESDYKTEIDTIHRKFEAFTGDRSFWANFLFAQVAYASLVEGVPVSFDVMPITVPLQPNCELRQIGYRFPGFERTLIQIDAETWRHFTGRQRALLMIHEALHDRFPSGAEGATALRQVVWYMASSPVFQLNNAELIRRVIATQRPASVQEFKP